MRLFILVSLSLIFTFSSFGNPSVSAQTASPADHAVIKRRRLVLLRSAELVKDFPHKKRAVVTYPIISGLSTPVLRRVQTLIDFKNIFDYSLKEYREDAWLDEFSYVVNHNGNYLLDITFNQSGSAAYPDDQTKHFLINLRDGRLVKAADVFEADKVNQVVAVVDRQLQKEIERLKAEIKEPDEKETVEGAYDNLKFELKDVDSFSVNSKGLTFLYDAGFPHVIRALQPDGRYFFPYGSLREVIKRDGPLGQFIR